VSCMAGEGRLAQVAALGYLGAEGRSGLAPRNLLSPTRAIPAGWHCRTDDGIGRNVLRQAERDLMREAARPMSDSQGGHVFESEWRSRKRLRADWAPMPPHVLPSPAQVREPGFLDSAMRAFSCLRAAERVAIPFRAAWKAVLRHSRHVERLSKPLARRTSICKCSNLTARFCSRAAGLFFSG